MKKEPSFHVALEVESGIRNSDVLKFKKLSYKVGSRFEFLEFFLSKRLCCISEFTEVVVGPFNKILSPFHNRFVYAPSEDTFC